MTKDEIRKSLEDRLNSPTWNALKTSFLGKELIEYAVNVIFLSEQQSLSIQNNQYPDTADLESLLMVAFNRDIPIDLSDPAFVKIKANKLTLVNPYRAYLKSGNISFVNYDYMVPGKETIFYQGNIKTMFTKELQSIQEYERVEFKLYYDVEEKSYFVKLGKSAISDSVIVYKESQSLLVVSEYDSLREDPTAEMVKIKRNTDKSLNVYFGNGVWGKEYDKAANYQILWIDGTNEDFDVTTLNLTVLNEEVGFSVESYSSGSQDDLQYTRNDLKSKMVEYSVAATESQIKEFVKNYPDVLDCEISLDESNSNLVTIYVKPTVIDDTIFDQVADGLNIHGEIVTQYKVLRGNPLYFYVQLSALASLTEQKKLEIENLIKDALAYNKLPYVTQVSSVYLNELLSSQTQGSVSVSILFRLFFDIMSNVVALPTKPYRGSIQLIKNDEIIGWDSEGVLYGAVEPKEFNLGELLILGDFFINSGDSYCVSYNENFTVLTDNTGYLPLKALKGWLLSDDRLLAKFEEGFKEIDINEAFYEGDFSIQKNPTVTIIPYSEIDSDLDIDLSVYKKSVGLFKLMKVGDDNQYYLWKYDINNNLQNTLNFSVLVSGGGNWTPKAVVADNENLYAFFKEGLRYVANYTTPSSAENVRIDNIPALSNLDLIKQVILGNAFTILLEEEVSSDDIKYSIYRSSGFDIEEGQIKRMILRSEFVLVYQNSFPEKQDIEVLSSSLDKVIFINRTSGEVISYVNGTSSILIKNGNLVNEVVKLGIVSYVNNQIQLQGKQIQDVTVEYQTAEALELLPKDTFPVMGDVEWK